MLRRDVAGNSNTTARDRPPDPSDRRIRQTWLLFGGSFFALGLAMVLRLGSGRDRPLDWALVALLVVVGFAAIRHRVAVQALENSRRLEAEGFARILSGLSRSVSPDAIVDAIVEELGSVTRADHIVVVRRRPDARTLEATLVSSRAGVPASTTMLPLADLADPRTEVVRAVRADRAAPTTAERSTRSDEREPVAIPIRPELPSVRPLTAAALLGDVPAAGELGMATVTASGIAMNPGTAVMSALRDAAAGASATLPRVPVVGAAYRAVAVGDAPADALGDDQGDANQRVATRIAERVRSVYGLKHTLASALVVDGEPIGALVLSRRVPNTWPESTERLLEAAASEASAALSRAYSHRQAETLASTDALTGLPNRRYFDEFCGLLARRRRAEDAVGVLMIDIDKFKTLNDRFGHAVGDEVLRSVASAIAAAVRGADVPARYGGEEFAVLLRNPGPTVAVEVGERVRMAVRSLDLRRHGVPGVSVSVGVALASDPDEPIEGVIEQADRALYRAKRAGRDRVVAA